QQVTITGLGGELFDKGLRNLQEINGMFDRYFLQDAMTKWTNAELDGHLVMNAGNRFFTSLDNEPGARHVSFGAGVDPLGVLQTVVGNRMVHAAENVVSYFKQTNKYIYDTAFPGNFRVGDMVEVEVSVIAFKSRNKMIKMHCNLRVLTLIDGIYSKVRR
ncbi:hypothetical protein B0H17DRAFT_865701, partial [Mycena rosella]